MKAVIMAAGPGTRINRKSGKPKCTLHIFDGKPLILYTVEILRSLDVNDIIVVSGYGHEILEGALAGTDVVIKYNPFFGVANSIGSAWFGDDLYTGGEDVLLINGDSFYEKSLFHEMINDRNSPLLLVDKAGREDADVKVLIRDGIATKYGKNIDGPVDAESTDLIKLNAEHALVFRNKIREMLDSNHYEEYWEAVVFNLPDIPVVTKDVEGVFWGEIDDIDDYERIIDYTTSKEVSFG